MLRVFGLLCPLALASTLLTCPAISGQPIDTSCASKPDTCQSAAPDLGLLTNGLYRNSFFGFFIHLPFGWVERTAQMRQDSLTPPSSLLLLAAWERPPEATDNTVNSTILIAAEKLSTYPGLKAPEQYFGPITEVATSKGLKVVNQPYDFRSGKQPLVRADFSKERGDLTILQSTLVLLRKGYVVSFTFIGESQDEVEELISKLSFSTTSAASPHPR